ncbi:phage tail tape measure protein [Planktomarina sp.]|uniref:phage tail tape measure protein n=1 Tax=Planktomarina sp. TaxID=2024851 RepID=UPI003260B9F1
MADNEFYYKIILDNKEASKNAKTFQANIKGIGKVNLGASQNAIKAMGSSLNEASGFAKVFAGTMEKLADGSPALRYALYDIRNTMLGIAAASAAIAVGPIAASIKYERSFANVIRTNELVGETAKTATDELELQLKRIAQTSPISWEDITNIATLAGQLGVAQKDIANFTETVAKFAATTDLSVDASATAFGRLDQLIDGVDGKFENLGSAILGVGVDSVATESQIVNVATNIASMGNLARLTAPEIIGLSGAIASLGIRPELARGNVTRLFSNIGRSAVEGGFNVQEFGRLTGRTADEFVADWSTRPGAVLQDFFDGINKEGPEAERTLRSLGITSVRDIPAILRLAQNSDEVRRLIGLSADEYVYATKVSEQYGIISGTTSEQIARLGQNFELLLATIGGSVGPLSSVFQFLNLLVQGFTKITESPIGQFISGVVIVLALLASALAAAVAALAGTAASILALNYASNKLGFTLKDLILSALGSAKSLNVLNASAKGATVGIGALGAAMRIAMPVLLITSIVSLVAGIAGLGDESDTTTQKINALYGGMDGLRAAIDKDTAAFNAQENAVKGSGQAIITYDRILKTSNESIQSRVNLAGDFVDADGKVKTAVDATTESIEEQTRAVNENAAAYLEGSLLQNADAVSVLADPGFQQAFIDTGVTIQDLIAAGIKGEADPLIDALIANQKRAVAALSQEGIQYIDGPQADPERFRQINEEIAKREALIKAADGAFRDQIVTANDAIKADYEYSQAAEFVNGTLEDQAAYASLSKDAISDLMDEVFGAANAAAKTRGAFVDLGEEIAGLEGSALVAEGAIQSVVNSILEGTLDPELQIANLAQTILLLGQAGIVSGPALDALNQAIDGVAARAGIGANEVARLVNNAYALNDLGDAGDAIAEGIKKVETGATGAAKKVETLAEKFDKLVESMFESINLGRDAEDAIFSLGEAFGETGDQALYASDEMQDAIGSILAQSSSAEEGVANLAALFSNLAGTVGAEATPSLQILRQAISQVAAAFGITEAQAQQFIDTAGGGISNINFDNFNRGIQSAQQEVRTLLDYASDLESVFSRAFDIRFSSTFAIDEIAAAWFDLGQNVEDARQEIEDLITTQEGLSADRSLKEYFLSVAEAYGDTLRAGILREELAALNKGQEDNAKAIAEAQAIAGGDLTGQGPGQRQNRAALLGLVGDYQGYITALAESGASQDELRKATERARKEFIAQAIELGYQEDVVMQYAAAFDDVRTAIDRVPRDITVDANVNPALQALNELNASLNKQISAARSLNAELGKPIEVRQKVVVQDTVTLSKPLYLTRTDAQEMALFRNKAGFADGGYTGAGGKMQPAGIVHKGEYVVPQKYVNQSTGLPDANFLSQLQNGVRGYAQGGFVNGGMGDGTMMVELSPYDRKLLADAGNVQLRVDGKVVASATNRSNFNEARRGSN